MSLDKNSLIQTLRRHQSVMDSVCNRLDAIAESLSFLGMDRGADRIYDEMARIGGSTAELLKAHRDDLDQRYNDMQKHVGGVLTALLDNVESKKHG